MLKNLIIVLFLFSCTFASQEQGNYSDNYTTPAKLEKWGKEIVTFRTTIFSITPQQRVQNSLERLSAIPHQDSYKVEYIKISQGDITGAWIVVDNHNIIAVTDKDIDPNFKGTFEEFLELIKQRIETWLDKRSKQKSVPLLLKGVGLSIVATILFFVIFSLMLRYGHKADEIIETKIKAEAKVFVFAGVDTKPFITMLGAGLIKLITWGLGLPLAYGWLTYVFNQFPITHSWGEQLSSFIFDLLTILAHNTISALPGIGAVIVIYLITRLFLNVLDTFFSSIQNGTLYVTWLEPETARASRRVIVVLVWIFALVVAYPYIPGSGSEAFKGISVFLGLMLSLGSAGIVGQILGGIVVVYTRAFQTGDYVQINEYEGNIIEIGVLSTKIKTLKYEEITIPNATLLSATTTNYSKYAKNGGGAYISTVVTIGYDTPWRQVHAMLEMASDKTSLIKKHPQPLVLQRALSDFYVEYTLRVVIERPEQRYLALSELHAHIQDVFNEYGVQIMSPNFEAQPDEKIWVPKEQWSPLPALKED